MIPLIGAHDFPYLFLDQVRTLFSMPLTWAVQSHDSLGVFTLSTLWDWPYGLLYGLAGRIGLPFTISVLGFGILPALIVGWVGMGKLLKGYSLSLVARLTGQLLYVANTYLLMLIDGGQLSLAVAYSLLPLAMFNLPSRLNFILTIAAISFLDIRYLYLVAIIIGLKIFFEPGQLLKYLATGLITGLVIVLLHSYWILPAIFSKGPTLPSTYTRSAQVESLSFATIGHAQTLLHPHWPKNIFGQVAPLSPYFLVLPILAFLSLVIMKRNKIIAFWSILAVSAIFLVKGSGPPVSGAYEWLFSYVPGFSLFRDPSKFFPLITLAYSVLVAFSVEAISTRYKRVRIAALVVIGLLLLPIFLGKATGLFSIARNQNDYQHLSSFLESDTNPGGLLWVPSKPPLGYASPIHPSMDALTLLSKRPFATGVVGNYELLNFLRDASYSGELLDIASIKYLAIPSLDPKRDSMKIEDQQYRATFSGQLASREWVKQSRAFGDLTLLETKGHQPLFFTPSSTKFVVGADNIYTQVLDLSDQALVFVESQPGLLNHIHRFPQAQLILNGKSEIDAAAALLSHSLFFPSTLLPFSPDASGWWKRETSDLVSWRDFLQQKYSLDNQDFDYGGGWAVSEGANTLSMELPDSCQSDCVLLARVMVSSMGGSVRFANDDEVVGEVVTMNPDPATVTRKLTGYQDIEDQIFTYDQADFYWVEIGEIATPGKINILTTGDINVVNAIALVDRTSWQELKSEASQLIALRPSETYSSPRVTYREINPTHFKVTVVGLTQPTTLVFAQNYDSFWRIGNQDPVPVYSLLNGFSILSDGEYEVMFVPQKYVLPGLTITLTTTLFLALWLWRGSRHA